MLVVCAKKSNILKNLIFNVKEDESLVRCEY